MGLLQRIQRALASGSQPVMWGTAAVVTGIYVVYDVTRVVKNRVKEPAPETAFDKTDVEQWNQFVLFQEKQKKEAEAAKAAAPQTATNKQ